MQSGRTTLVYLTRASPAERVVREWAARQRHAVRFCADAFDLLTEALLRASDAPTTIVLEGLLLEPGAASWVERLHRRLPQAAIVLLDARRADDRGPVSPWLLPCSTAADLGPLLERCGLSSVETSDRPHESQRSAGRFRPPFANAAVPPSPLHGAVAAPAAPSGVAPQPPETARGAPGARPRPAEIPSGAIDLDTLTREELAALLEDLEDPQSTGGPAVA
ncbi:MAG: hypothetical protein HRF50_07055 [Phycisphaerae bacterium]